MNLRTGEVSRQLSAICNQLAAGLLQELCHSGCSPGEQPAFGASSDVRAFDMRNGKLVWTFHTVPRPGELNHDVWKDGQWENRSGRELLGIHDRRRGARHDLCAVGHPQQRLLRRRPRRFESLWHLIVALDANTGKLKWYFQTTHHDNWD